MAYVFDNVSSQVSIRVVEQLIYSLLSPRLLGMDVRFRQPTFDGYRFLSFCGPTPKNTPLHRIRIFGVYGNPNI